jgi:hypothetical protein
MYAEEYRHPPPTLGYLAGDPDCTGVFCWCNRCHHNSVIPLAAMIAQLGPDLPFPSVHGRLRCQACGSKDIHARPDWRSLGQVTRHHRWKKPDEASADGLDEVRAGVLDVTDSG